MRVSAGFEGLGHPATGRARDQVSECPLTAARGARWRVCFARRLGICLTEFNHVDPSLVLAVPDRRPSRAT